VTNATEKTPEANVICLSHYREESQTGAIARVESYWETLRDGRIMPCRSEVDPRGIAGALENAFVLERVARGVGRFRLAGMHLNDILGMEVRGMPLTSLILPGSRDDMNAVLAAVFDEPAVARLSLVSDSGFGRPKFAARMVLLPLRSDLGDVSRVLGCFVTDGKIGRAPRRFDIVERTQRTLIGYGDTRPANVTASRVTLPTAPSRPLADRANLRLVHNRE
jgi:hypothetical protein